MFTQSVRYMGSRLLVTAAVAVMPLAVMAIDVKPFVQQPQYEDMVLSPSGDYLAMIVKAEDSDYPYKTELRVLDLKNKKITSVLRFPRNLSVADAQWFNDERILLRAEKKRGSRAESVPDANIVAVNFDGSKQLTIFGPQAGSGSVKALAAQEDWANLKILRLKTDDPQRMLIQKQPWVRDRDTEVKPVVTYLNVYNARQTGAETIDIRDSELTIDNAGVVRFAEHVSEEGYAEMFYRADAESDWKQLFQRGGNQGFWQPLSFERDDKKVLIEDNTDSETTGLALLDPATGERTTLYRAERVDLGEIYWTADGREPFAFSTAVTGKPSLHLLNAEVPEAAVLKLAASTFPTSNIAISGYSADGKRAVVQIGSDIQPAVFYLIDSDKKAIGKIAEAAPWLKSAQLSPMEPVTIKARDGLQLSALLTVPKAKPAKDLPAVLLVHGGPYGVQDKWGYDAEVQLLAAAGYAVLQVNFRGSGGYGKSFRFDAYGQWGTTMQDDLTDATKWLAGQGIADANRICIMGHSYGGYASVWGLIKTPELYRCGIASMGVYDLSLMHEEGNIQRSRIGRHYLEQAIGTDPQSLAARSPVQHVAAIKAPLLLSHGDADEQVPIEHVERLIAALKDNKKTYEYLEFDDEAHGFASEANRVKFYEAVLAFLDKQIGH
ncbi:S9 family peptidase [Permianibacter sp. IMCC34836]|uniref:alpha/beta hydrolase family protein n=1 Tax=Permianibacter fluminis TaxID=2738515 RepID=UPI001555F13B|nr:S9 family peptidase [Permianibacter fluminis]NQD35773.1 S9 family peptidase [Permianibacter fluminis]